MTLFETENDPQKTRKKRKLKRRGSADIAPHVAKIAGQDIQVGFEVREHVFGTCDRYAPARSADVAGPAHKRSVDVTRSQFVEKSLRVLGFLRRRGAELNDVTAFDRAGDIRRCE